MKEHNSKTNKQTNKQTWLLIWQRNVEEQNDQILKELKDICLWIAEEKNIQNY